MESSKEILRAKKELEKEKKIKYIWVSDSDSCDTCSAMNGIIFDEEPSITSLHPNCKCYVEPFVVEKNNNQETEEISFLEKINNLVEANISNKNLSLQKPIKLKEKDDIWNIFLEEYKILKATNAIGHDAHQHALANARATSKYGKAGEKLAFIISEGREAFDIVKNISTGTKKSFTQIMKETEEDLISNRIGRELGLKYPNASRKFLSNKLYEEYGISNKYFRENLEDAKSQSEAYKK